MKGFTAGRRVFRALGKHLLVSNRNTPQYLLESNRNVTNDLETGELYGISRMTGPDDFRICDPTEVIPPYADHIFGLTSA